MDVVVSKRLLKKDGKCVICEIKYRNKKYIDEIYKGKKGLTSGYGLRGISLNCYKYNPKRIIYNNLNEALNAINKEEYKKFNRFYIRKVKNI